MSGEYFECGEHGWSYEPEDSCPVCDGIKLERERIIGQLNKKDRGRTHSAAMRCVYCDIITWLEESND
jgi:hypothetical protein